MTTQVTDQLAALQLEKKKPKIKGTISIGGWEIPVSTLNKSLKLSMMMRNGQPFRTLPMAYFPCAKVHHFPPRFEYGVVLRDAAEIRAFAACLKIPTDGLSSPSLVLKSSQALSKRCQAMEGWPLDYKLIRINFIETRQDYYVLYAVTNYSVLRDVITVSKLLPRVVREMGWHCEAAWHFSSDNKGKILEREDWSIKLGAKQRQPCICWNCV
ncbi:hypothetical protein CYLTODRAFT_426538 [Cylindrobasidium torrendii FP15055 ss-10]|uniref:Uncharacterized protein n=1 Tax=Cylindrobasidium torrendii FP15055 ss-10 TaxID=1314674 RepID=A0A0D7B089_9AGAR|nr:hypothetical protein CYLTODRAFT_426538 [Cylindrobasidium torrendii FP15055 ss-10]